MNTPETTPTAVTVPDVLRAVAGCAWRTARLVATGQLTMPTELVGRRLTLGDGTTPVIFRTTERPGAPTSDPSVLEVRFRLRWIGHRRALHRIFLTTCIINTPLFAGFPGFRRKQWMYDEQTSVYRGLYDWDGPDRAVWYAERLRRVLLLVAVPASIDYQVLPGRAVDDLLRDGDLYELAG